MENWYCAVCSRDQEYGGDGRWFTCEFCYAAWPLPIPGREEEAFNDILDAGEDPGVDRHWFDLNHNHVKKTMRVQPHFRNGIVSFEEVAKKLFSLRKPL